MSDATETVENSVCRICHGGCGVHVTLKDGKVTKVMGDRSSPINQGWMCIKGVRAPDIANHPDRLSHPLKRDGERGSKQWKRMAWEDALDEIAGKIDAIRTESGPESLVVGQGTGRHHYMHTVRFANALGTPNWYEPGAAQCFFPRINVSNLTYGGFVVSDYYSETTPECILFWGHNPLVSGPDGELASLVLRAFDKGAKGIAVDPRRCETAQRCDQWLGIRPGTDAALALAMIHVIIYEELYDKDFVENWTSGFDELKQHVANFTPQWAEQITWVKAEETAKAARTFARAKPAILEWGVGLEQNSNSLQTVRAIAILRALAGNIDVPGGDVLGMNAINTYPTLRETLPKEAREKRLAEGFKLLGGPRAFMPSAHVPSIYKAIREGDPYRVRGLLVFGGNPMNTVANTRGVYEALQKLDLLTVTDLFMTPTASMADYVLPAAFWTEVEQVIGYPLVAESIMLAQRKLTQHEECRQDEWIQDELSRRLDLPGCEETYRSIMDYQLEPLNLTYDELKEMGHYIIPHEYKKYEAKGFRTPTRKVELNCRALERMGYDALPTFVEPPESPVSQPDVAEKFPFVLITGSRKKEFFHSEQRQIASLRKRRPDPSVELHPNVAAKRGIQHGDWVTVESPRASIRMKAIVTEDIADGVVSCEHGWWFPDREDHGIFESNANLLTDDGPPYDPAFGSYRLRGLLCDVRVEV